MDDKNDRAPDHEAFWEGEGGDRTIASSFDPPARGPGALPSPVSEPPDADEEATRVGARGPGLGGGLAQPKTEPFAFGVVATDIPPPPSLAPAAAPPRPAPKPVVAAQAHVVVGDGAVGDEATLAVAAPSSQASNEIAAALAATLGPGWSNDAVPPSSPGSSPNPLGPWGPGPNAPAPLRPAAGVPVQYASPHVPGHAPPHAFGPPPTSPVASTLGGLPPPSNAFGPGSSPDVLRHVSSGAMPAAYPHPGSAPVQLAHPGASAAHPGAPGPWPPPPQAFPYPGPGPHGPMAPPRAAAPRSHLTLLIVVGVVCVTIFVVGVVLFVRTNL